MTDTDDASLVERVTERLITAVAVGEFLPGTRLPPERDLSPLLGVGRTTVRAALDDLSARGLIERRRGRAGGTFVAEEWPASVVVGVDRWFAERWDEIVDACTASSLLHSSIARLAAERRTDADIVAMRDRLAAFHAAESGDAKQRADSLLHLAIIDSAHNAALRDIVLGHESRLSLSAPAHPWGDRESHRRMESRAAREHDAIVEAIVSASPDAAADLARRHVGIDLELFTEAREFARRRAEAAAG
ncbi:FadR/GntR family transcriptional regulator [Microbacterium sp. SORGH_AS_0888]|uniref:FadR/GntR family transcriptional regulator n=1 Tax=Microbacterium sp. SORGH_AS_0888 TaxID=3041791 RepID=UPI00277E1716|nr:GntR family transcriptional regulator [Microbacterium sp. SORGH_AS_0888]MDQ1128945.1 GntR family transcriptional repressor for pyruvate dehydrogenase complex [Microbacterium sp. SORGH_AS_0888]